jgi:hypothetical protein
MKIFTLGHLYRRSSFSILYLEVPGYLTLPPVLVFLAQIEGEKDNDCQQNRPTHAHTHTQS